MLPLNIDVTQILLHVLNLVILVGGLTLILYKPLSAFLRERREHYEKLESENESKSEECEKLKKEYEQKLAEADAAISERRRESEKETAVAAGRYLEEARTKADAIVRAAEEEAESRKEHILESAQTEIGELVLTAAQKLLADTATPERDSDLYDEFIKLTRKDGGKEDGND